MARISVTAIFLVLLAPLVAQQAPSGNGPASGNGGSTTPTAAADRAWIDLVATARADPSVSEGPTPANQAARSAARAKQATKHSDNAKLAKEFYTKYPDHPKAVEARELEVMSLIGATGAGDAASEATLDSTVAALRADEKLAKAQRARVAGVYEFTRATRKSKIREERLAAIEKAARKLQGEFPDQLQGHSSLLTVASASDDTKYRQLLFELWQTDLPPGLKPRVRALLDRFYLSGERVQAMFADAAAKDLTAALRPGQPTIIYSWSTDNPASLAMAEEIRQRALAGAVVIGLNLDRDVDAAQQAARKNGLPGLHYFSSLGINNPLALRLKINSAPVVVLVDAYGVIRDTRGEYALAVKLAQLGL